LASVRFWMIHPAATSMPSMESRAFSSGVKSIY
jgi:hypothetical protein